MGTVHVFVNGSSHSSWTKLYREFGSFQEQELRGNTAFVQYYTEIGMEHLEEILNVNTVESASPSWTRSVLSHDQVIQWTKAKVRDYSDSVLCLGRCGLKKMQLQDGKVQ